MQSRLSPHQLLSVSWIWLDRLIPEDQCIWQEASSRVLHQLVLRYAVADLHIVAYMAAHVIQLRSSEQQGDVKREICCIPLQKILYIGRRLYDTLSEFRLILDVHILSQVALRKSAEMLEWVLLLCYRCCHESVWQAKGNERRFQADCKLSIARVPWMQSNANAAHKLVGDDRSHQGCISRW